MILLLRKICLIGFWKLGDDGIAKQLSLVMAGEIDCL